MDDADWFHSTCQQVIATRERMVAGLKARGFEVLPSAANFVFARRPGSEGASLAAGLRAHKVLVRHFRQPERIAPFLRISVGSEAQTDALFAALDAVLA
jgi:histidinol-phosphate aminotransferase